MLLVAVMKDEFAMGHFDDRTRLYSNWKQWATFSEIPKSNVSLVRTFGSRGMKRLIGLIDSVRRDQFTKLKTARCSGTLTYYNEPFNTYINKKSIVAASM